MDAANQRRGVIPAWRLVGGICLHFTVPAYLLTLVVAGTAAALNGRTPADMLGHVVHLSAWFLLAYALLGLVSVGLFAIGEGMMERWSDRATPEARRSARRLARAIATARKAFGDPAAPSLAILEGAWDHDDPRIRALTVDCAELVDRTARAIASAPADRRGPIVTLGRDALAHIAASFEALADERSRLDEGDARVIARYVETRYGPTDFPSGG